MGVDEGIAEESLCMRYAQHLASLGGYWVEAAESVLSHAERPGIPAFMHEMQEAERRAETRLSSGARRGRYVQPGISFSILVVGMQWFLAG